MHTYTHIYIHAYTHKHMNAERHPIRTDLKIYTSTHTHTHKHTHTHIHTHTVFPAVSCPWIMWMFYIIVKNIILSKNTHKHTEIQTHTNTHAHTQSLLRSLMLLDPMDVLHHRKRHNSLPGKISHIHQANRDPFRASAPRALHGLVPFLCNNPDRKQPVPVKILVPRVIFWDPLCTRRDGIYRILAVRADCVGKHGLQVCVCAYAHICTYMNMYIHIYVCRYAFICVHVCICLCIYCVYIYTYEHVYAPTHWQAMDTKIVSEWITYP
jgi:hypothetical protein